MNLLPCPFCGWFAVYAEALSAYRCLGCKSLGPVGCDQVDAMQLWNQRFFGGTCQVIHSDQMAIPSRGDEAPIDNDPASRNEQRQKPR